MAGTTGLLSTPQVAETTDAGATWTTFTNLPEFVPYDPNGTYQLNGISCTSALTCVAVGGLNESDGLAQVISTTDGGATWSLSPDPTLTGLQQFSSVSCIPVPGSLPTCHAAADALQSAGPVVVTSTDGGATWHGVETYDNTGWMDSISCPDVQHCWAAGAGTKLALAGTADGGSSWSAVTSDTTNEQGQVSCASLNLCVAATDSALWVDSGGGFTATAAGGAPGSANPATLTVHSTAHPVTRRLPRASAGTSYARAGTNTAITGQYRGTSVTALTVTVTNPGGQTTNTSVPIGLNGFYSASIPAVGLGTSSIKFSAGQSTAGAVMLNGHSGPAPVVTGLSDRAGPAAGGRSLVLTGANLAGATAVYFGSQPAPSLTYISAAKLSVRTPAGGGAQFVRVVTATGGESAITGRAVYNFLKPPSLKQLRPTAGPARGKTIVTIRGTGFAFVRAVYFGTRKGSHLVVLSAGRIRITAPPGTGTVNVRVRTAAGITAIVTADKYRY
jgi:hypothetical protein